MTDQSPGLSGRHLDGDGGARPGDGGPPAGDGGARPGDGGPPAGDGGPPAGDLHLEGPPTGDPSVVVRAAGGVVWQRRDDGSIEVVLVHRPRYDDWSLPKGKVDPGETDEEAARREVEEESRVVARLGAELPGTTYIDRSGRTKTVRYWAMTPERGEPGGSNEVDDAQWLPIAEARRRLTYDRDIPVLDSLPAVIGDHAR